MGRPPRHGEDELLDAAVRLFAEGGARAVTMAAVAREAGAPSGSVYHRFADRSSLLAALWLRTVQRFHSGYLPVLAEEPPIEAAIRSTSYVIRWSRDHLEETQVLYAGKRAFGEAEWSAEHHAAAKETDQNLEHAWRGLLRRLRPATGQRTDELLLVLVDLPYGALRRYLEQGQAPPARTIDLVARAARTLLSGGEADG
ncbi:AcrR family transcriptional regulator [Amycolatopsis bartoniae]|nr:TetR/AcrR family transcriptional regulator [Amycolatopsis bartoniae]MBB2934213.1 AcrR family transcriptional regulator [Amycolatopsis bartoniae]TVT08421.1 TetR/AcrR family transcriptional regulator [Amycolatopsis bartoniae]